MPAKTTIPKALSLSIWVEVQDHMFMFYENQILKHAATFLRSSTEYLYLSD